MKQNPLWVKAFRIIAILMMGITAFLTLASGAGTVCVALAAERFGAAMAPLIPYKWLYSLFVILTLAIGVAGVRAVILLIRGRKGSYRFTLLTLIAALLIGGIHLVVSRALRGKSMPTDPVVYMTLITLVLFLILRLPSIRERVDFEHPEGDSSINTLAAALTLLACGMLTLTVGVWAGPSHTFEASEINWANAWAVSTNTLGTLLLLSGGMILGLRRVSHGEPLIRLFRQRRWRWS